MKKTLLSILVFVFCATPPVSFAQSEETKWQLERLENGTSLDKKRALSKLQYFQGSDRVNKMINQAFIDTAFNDPKPSVRSTSVWYLTSRLRPEYVNQKEENREHIRTKMTELAMKEKNPDVLRGLIKFWRLPNEVLLCLFEHKSPFVHRGVAKVLHWKNREKIPDLLRGLDSHSVDIRIVSILSLSLTGGSEVSDALIRASKDESPLVRRAALVSLSFRYGNKSTNEKIASVLVGALNDSDRRVVEIAKLNQR